MPTVHLLIKGKVQGVFYRASTKEKADELKVTGWVKNTTNGDVEAVVTGTEEQVHSFVEWCKKGPRRAEVSEVITTQKPDVLFEEFTVIRDR